MKTTKLKSIKTTLWTSLCLALIPLFLANPSYAQKAEGQSGNGGGGIYRNGRYMTFFSAGLYTEPNEATISEIPQLQELLTFFNTTPYMSESTKIQYASKLIPASTRRYYKVTPNKFTPAVRARLIAEYARVMKVNPREVTLFAITDTNSKNTYLLPEFYSLRPTEQKAILFHEAYWLVNPKSNYNTVINAETAFQAYIENPSSAERLIRWIQTAGSRDDAYVAAIQFDLANHSLNEIISENTKIKLKDLLGNQFFECKNRRLMNECTPLIATHAYSLTLKYPQSVFLKLFYESASSDKFEFIDNYRSYFSSSILNTFYNVEFYYDKIAEQTIDLQSAFFSGKAEFRTDSNAAYDLTLILH